MVVDVGTVKQYIKPKSDSTLYNMRKRDLIEYVRSLEHNYNVAVSFNENQVKYIESMGVLPKWIPVSERLPEDDRQVLACTKKGKAFSAHYDHRWKSWSVSHTVKITHWMPLPEPPK